MELLTEAIPWRSSVAPDAMVVLPAAVPRARTLPFDAPIRTTPELMDNVPLQPLLFTANKGPMVVSPGPFIVRLPEPESVPGRFRKLFAATFKLVPVNHSTGADRVNWLPAPL